MIVFRAKNITPPVISTTGFIGIIACNVLALWKLRSSVHRCYLDRIRKDLALFEQTIHEIDLVYDSEAVRLDSEAAFDLHPLLATDEIHPSLNPVYDWDPKRCRQKLRQACKDRMQEWRALVVEEMTHG